MIWGDKVDYNTWFGAGVVYALGINMMPFTPLSEIYLDQVPLCCIQDQRLLHSSDQVVWVQVWKQILRKRSRAQFVLSRCMLWTDFIR